MSQGPSDPSIPTLTQVVKPATRPKPAQATPHESAPAPAQEAQGGPDPAPLIPAPGTLPPDLDVELSLEELDDPTPSLAPPGLPGAPDPVPAPAQVKTAPETPARDVEALRARIEQSVDAALAARIPALREQVVRAVLASLGERSRKDDSSPYDP